MPGSSSVASSKTLHVSPPESLASTSRLRGFARLGKLVSGVLHALKRSKSEGDVSIHLDKASVASASSGSFKRMIQSLSGCFTFRVNEDDLPVSKSTVVDADTVQLALEQPPARSDLTLETWLNALPVPEDKAVVHNPFQGVRIDRLSTHEIRPFGGKPHAALMVWFDSTRGKAQVDFDSPEAKRFVLKVKDAALQHTKRHPRASLKEGLQLMRMYQVVEFDLALAELSKAQGGHRGQPSADFLHFENQVLQLRAQLAK